ncbi:MAG: carboxypeptidase regulatory-like domain-containing protein [Bryobacterales bacterium]|nr:carboxypeptidase regulatory-like domain-containing protein [Bryobacterales bacterium]
MRSPSVAAGVVVCALSALAQSDRGTITGTVSDPAGAVIAAAAIEARNVATGAVYPTASSTTGNYTISQLPVGTYDLTVNVMGFKKFIRTGLVVEVAGTLRVDANLEVGSASESVTVTEAAPLLKTEGGEVSYNVATSTLNELPILTLSGSPNSYANPSGLGNIRNPLASVSLLPGAQFSTDNIMRINGMPSSSQSINIEGQDATNGFYKQRTQVNQAGVEAIQEVAIQTSNFAAEYGQAGGGYFNYTMKSGANELHGSGFDYFVNEALNAGFPFTNAGATNSLKNGQHIRNPIRQNDYGFTLGGPVHIPKLYNGHDKTFFFFSFEQFRQSTFTINSVAIVPTAAQRAGDFSAALTATGSMVCNGPDPLGQPVCLNEIFDPQTQQIVNGSVVRTPFLGNKIPMTRIDPTAAIVQNMVPLPNAAGLTNYIAPGYANFRHTTIPSIKIDHNLSDKLKLSGYYSATQTHSPQNNGFPQPFSTLQQEDWLAQTVRLNVDDSLTPTLLLHFGAGLLHFSYPQNGPTYDQAANNLFPQGTPFPAKNFIYLAGMYSVLGGGWSGGGPYPANTSTGFFFNAPSQYDLKPTFNSNLTWVRGNHTYKLGATALFEGLPTVTTGRAQGEFTFSPIETSDPWQNGQPFVNTASSGFGYASYFLGLSDGTQVGRIADLRLGYHSWAIYIQDSWKVTRKLTFDYGLRWDYANLWTEEHGRMQSAAFNVPNSTVGGRLGAPEYEATCKCSFATAYPYSIGPHLGLAYQIDPKTVFRAGGAISYGSQSDDAGVNHSAADFLNLGTPAYGTPSAMLKNGDVYAPGNVLGNPVLTWPNSFLQTPYSPAPTGNGIVPPAAPFISIAANAGRLPRIFQWSLGFQREITRNVVAEAAYVGNRGAWWVGPLLAGLNYNALTPQGLFSQYGIDVTNPSDALLLSKQIGTSQVVQRFPWLANPASVYPGFPSTQPLNQALRPYPQWLGIPPFLGPPMGRTWYDSLQLKLTKRFSHGLSLLGAYTWQKELTNGTNANTAYLTPSPPLINDVFNIPVNKQISGFSRPQMLVVSFSYTTPKLQADTGGLKILSWVARDWNYSGVLRYQSGQILQTPPSANNLLSNLARGPSNNPAVWGGGYTFLNRVAGQPLFLVDPNSKFDPATQLVLNPKAWVEPPYGTFGASAPYFNDFRWQRQPSESMAFGRTFPISKEGKYRLQIRAEFQNIFNRMLYSLPSIGGGATITTPTGHNNSLSGVAGLLSSGYGFVPWVNGAGAQPRSGQLVARFQF